MVDKITVLIVTHNTEKLVQDCLDNLHRFYRTINTLVIDNHSTDQTEKILKNWLNARKLSRFYELLPENIGHGPAMNRGFTGITTDYILTLDSDCMMKAPNMLEKMSSELENNSNALGIGWVRYVQINGVSIPEGHDPTGYTPYLHPCVALWRRSIYLTLPPFRHHGAPAVDMMRNAHLQHIPIISFPVFDYVDHLVAGTRSLYSGRWDPKEGETPKVKPGVRYPI